MEQQSGMFESELNSSHLTEHVDLGLHPTIQRSMKFCARIAAGKLTHFCLGLAVHIVWPTLNAFISAGSARKASDTGQRSFRFVSMHPLGQTPFGRSGSPQGRSPCRMVFPVSQIGRASCRE